MSTDARVTKDLMQTLKDGEDGFARAAERVGDSSADLSSTLRQFSQQRSQFYAELDQLAQTYGDDVDDAGSVAGALHRGWISLKDAVTGDSPKPVLDAAVTGEDHAVSEYEKALEEDLSGGLRAVVERQLGSIRQARDAVSQLASNAA